MDKFYFTGSSYFIDKKIKEYTPEGEDIEIEIFFGDEINKEEFLNYINTMDIFGNTKVALIRNVNKIKELEQLVTFMGKSQECILLASSIANNKIDQNIIKLFQHNGFKILAEENKKTSASIDDVMRIFKEKNIILNYNQAELLLNKCLNNLNMVENEADKMQIYILSRKEKVPVSMLLEQISGEKEESIYALSDAFGMRNLEGALRIYSTMDKNVDNNFKLFFTLTRRIYNLYLLLFDDTFMKKMQSFQITKIKEQRKKWKEIELVKILDKISEIDKDVKTGLIDINNALLALLMLVCIKLD